MNKRGLAILPIIIILSIISGITALYLTTNQNSNDRLRSRTYKTDIDSIRSAVRAAVEDPLLCSEMLRGKPLPPVAPVGAPGGTPDNINGVAVSLNMSYGPLPAGTGPLEKGWPKNAAAPKDWAPIGDVRLWTNGTFLGYVVLDRPAAGGNPLDQWYEVYEARILIYGVQGQANVADPNSLVGYGSGLPPTPNSVPAPAAAVVDSFNTLTIPIIVHVKYRGVGAPAAAVVHGCYAPTSSANFCRTIDNYVPDPPDPAAPKITGGFDTDPAPLVAPPSLPQWAGLTNETYAPHRCHPETCVNMSVGGVNPGVYNTASATCPKPYISKKLGMVGGVDRENCQWCNKNRNAPISPIVGGVVAPVPTRPPPPPCGADFYVTCTGTSNPGMPPVIYTMVACEELFPDPPEPYVNIMRGAFSTGWVAGTTATFNPNDGTLYTLTSVVNPASVTITGTPSGACPVTGTSCATCTATQAY